MSGNYQHSFHAGNHADILKHVVLLQILQALSKKDKPFFVLDTHAGRGSYDLNAHDSARTQEWQSGVQLLQDWPQAPEPVQALQNILRDLNKKRGQTYFRYYAGSPLLVETKLRAQDSATFCEINMEARKALEAALTPSENARVLQTDGYHQVKALLPPKEKRGLVLIDPPYEGDSDSWSSLVNVLKEGHRRFATGVFAIWYPIKAREETERFYRLLKHSGIKDIARIELVVFDEIANTGLNGSGMMVINPPYLLLETMQQCLPLLWQRLSSEKKGRYVAEMLV